MDNKKKCYCKGYGSQPSAAPRLWKCPRHGKTGIAITVSIVRQIAEQYEVRYETAWDWAHALLEWKRAEYRKDDEIYYCEDHFNKDLFQEFDLEQEDSDGDGWWKRLKDNISHWFKEALLTESYRESRF